MFLSGSELLTLHVFVERMFLNLLVSLKRRLSVWICYSNLRRWPRSSTMTTGLSLAFPGIEHEMFFFLVFFQCCHVWFFCVSDFMYLSQHDLNGANGAILLGQVKWMFLIKLHIANHKNDQKIKQDYSSCHVTITSHYNQCYTKVQTLGTALGIWPNFSMGCSSYSTSWKSLNKRP